MMSTDDNTSFFIHQDNGTYDPTTLPRPRNFRECQQSRNEPWNDAVATVAPIEFLYSVETTETIDLSSLSLEAKEAIMFSVSAAIIESIYEYDCPSQQRALSMSSSRSRSKRRRMEIQSISPGNGHVWLGECNSNIDNNNNNNNIVESSNNRNCNEIDGTVVIGFDEENGSSPSDFSSVGNVVLSRIQEDMTNGNYLEQVNTDIQKQNFNVTVTDMKYINSDYFDLVDQDVLASLNSGLDDVNLAADQTGMTLFSKAAIPVMVVLFVLAMAFCLCALMSWPAEAIFWKNKKKKKEKFDEESEGNLYSKKDSTLQKPKAEDLRYYTNAHPHKLSSRSSTMDVPRNSGRDGRLSLKGKDDKDLPSSSYSNGDNTTTNSNSNKRRKNKEEDKVLSPSLEATLKDLTEAELKSFGNASYAVTRGQTFSTLPMGNTSNTRGNRFLPIPTRRSRSQSMMHVVEISHPASDTETDNDKSGCSSNISGLHDENSKDSMGTENNKIDFVKVDDIQYVSSKPNKKKKRRQLVQHQEQSTPPILPSSRSVFSSFFTSTDNRKETQSPAINLVERVTACTSDNNRCLGDTEEMPAPDNNNNNVVLNYIPGSSTPLRATQVPHVPTISTSSSARMSTKKSAAYRDYINKKMLLRNHSLERNHSLDGSLYEDVPMEIGLKRSFVDTRGKVREMVAL